MAYQSISRDNQWINPEAADQLNVMIDSLEKKIYDRETTYDIPTQSLQMLAIDRVQNNASFLRSGHILTLSFTVEDTKRKINLPVSTSGTYALSVSSGQTSFPALLKDNVISFPYTPSVDGPYHIYTVIVI